jgi:hypothetical protein
MRDPSKQCKSQPRSENAWHTNVGVRSVALLIELCNKCLRVFLVDVRNPDLAPLCGIQRVSLVEGGQQSSRVRAPERQAA